MSNKIVDFLKKKENVEMVRLVGQMVVFMVILLLILFFCSLINPQFSDIKTLLYAICILIALLIVMVISGGIEISVGDLFKVKKDTEEIKKEMASLRILLKATQHQSNSSNIYVSAAGGGTIEKYSDINDETFDVEDTDENTFYSGTATTKDISLN